MPFPGFRHSGTKNASLTRESLIRGSLIRGSFAHEALVHDVICSVRFPFGPVPAWPQLFSLAFGI